MRSTSASCAPTEATPSSGVARGETLTVTRAGVPVAELRPLRREPLSAATLLDRWQRVPHVDAARLRDDLDEVLDPRYQ